MAGGETLMTGGEPMVAGGSLEAETGCRLDASLVGRHRPLPLAGRRSGIKPIHSFVLLLEIQQFHQLQSDCSISRGLVTGCGSVCVSVCVLCVCWGAVHAMCVLCVCVLWCVCLYGGVCMQCVCDVCVLCVCVCVCGGDLQSVCMCPGGGGGGGCARRVCVCVSVLCVC